METITKYLTLKEASYYTRIPVPTLRLFRAQGRGPESFLLANRVTYEVEKLDQWIAEQKASTVRGA
jgi:hypothetical protein